MGGRKIRVGIIGCGWIACRAHIPAFQKVDDAEIMTVFGVNNDLASETGGRVGIHHVSDTLEW